MQANGGTDRIESGHAVAAADPAAAAGQRVYSSWRSDRIDRGRDGRWSCIVSVTYGTVEMIGDRPMVRHGATYEDWSDRWHTTEAEARAAQADVILEMAAGLLEQAARLRAEKGPPGGVVPASR